MEAAGYVYHRENKCFGIALSSLGSVSVLKDLKGVCAHFHRSDKVSFNMLYISCLENNQVMPSSLVAFNHLYTMGFLIDQRVTRPPAAWATRWAGILLQIAWMNEHKDVLQMYVDKPATNFVASDDGTTLQGRIIDK